MLLMCLHRSAPIRPEARNRSLRRSTGHWWRQGHRSLVIACAGSKTAGELIATLPLPAKFTEELRQRAQQEHRHQIERSLRQWPVDVVHCHGHDFAEYLPPPGVPTLVTLHLPFDHYPPEALSEHRPGQILQLRLGLAAAEFPGE